MVSSYLDRICRRPAYQYEAERIEGAVNISTFRPVAGKGKWDVIKKIAMGALAMKATGLPCKASTWLDRSKRIRLSHCSK